MTRPFHIMAKPAGPRCNLACDYCYYLEKEPLFPDRRLRMGREVLERFVCGYIDSQRAAGLGEIWFAWQGGEPALMGLAWFRELVALQARHCPPGHRIRNALQTNGTLIDAEFAAFLAEHRFLVGVSLDGPPGLHDRYRRDRRGQGSAARVLAGLEALRGAGAEVNLLCTVNRDNARHPHEVYRHLREQGRFLQFIPVVERLAPDGSLAGPPQPGDEALPPAPWSVAGRDYGRFLCAVFDDWIRQDVGRIHVQLFDMALGVWLGQPASLCVHARTCGDALAVEQNGDVFACDHYVYPAHRLGNLTEMPLADLAANPAQRAFGAAKADVAAACRACPWLALCGGGCPKHRSLPPDAEGRRRSMLCDGYRMFFAHAAPYLATMARLIRSGQPAAAIMPLLARSKMRPGVPGRNAPCPCGSGRKFKHCCAQR